MMKKAIISLILCGGSRAFAPPSAACPPRGPVALSSSVAEAEAPASASGNAPDPASAGANAPTWETKQHLYGLNMFQEWGSSPGRGGMSVTLGPDGEEVGGGDEGLPLPNTYVTCGKCKALFAIAEEDLGTKGKGCRVKCSICDNSWYQTRDRLFEIPTSTHDLLPAHRYDLDRIARNVARGDVPPYFPGVGKLYVGNLDWSTTSEDLVEFFERNAAGVDVCDAQVITGPDGRSRGFAFVSFYNKADGKVALQCNGMECNGREVSVREPNN